MLFALRRATAVLALLILLGPSLGYAQELAKDREAILRELESFAGTMECCSRRNADSASRIPDQQASVSRSALFSSEEGSWPFESFTHRGLFEMIAQYQPKHPQAIALNNGTISLAELYRRIDDEQVIKQHKDGYLLYYPLMIGPKARLTLDNDHLYMATYSGTALINQGELLVKNSTVGIWQGDNPAAVKGFRPFIVAWAGSRTHLDGAVIRDLGFNAHLTRGITLVRNVNQPKSLPEATVTVENTLFDDNTTGLDLVNARASVSNSRFLNNRLYGIDLADGLLEMRGSTIRDTSVNSGLRIQKGSRVTVRGSVIRNSAGSGVEATDFSGKLMINDSVIATNNAEGILIQGAVSRRPDVVLGYNFIAVNGRSGIFAENVERLYLRGNSIQAHARYNVSNRSLSQRRGQLIMVDNQLARADGASLRTANLDRIGLFGNDFSFEHYSQSQLGGELSRIQSRIFDVLIRHGCDVELLRSDSSENWRVIPRQPSVASDCPAEQQI